jgi:two-component system osmolarity sensor histidine kinase EnvZ
MLAGVSHDLRTPLTRMKLELAMIPASDMTESLDAEVRSMERMVEEYLAFARGEETESPTPTDLDAMLANLVERAGARRADIALHSSGKLTVEVRRDALRRALGNLLDNALRHGRKIAISARRRGRTIEIVVDDDGPGIPEAEREAVFRPFFRLDEARSAETGGVGLGLTIARDAVRRHGGDLTLDQAPLGGLRARVTLPI